MAFRGMNSAALARFNSSTSSEFLSAYEEFVDAQILADAAEPSSRTIAPSSFRCDRKTWFRLRGTLPDVAPSADYELNWAAEIGTACHRIIQGNLIQMLGADWIPVSDYINHVRQANPDALPYVYSFTPAEDSAETLIELESPPIRFACDGVVRLNDRYYLLEIKSVDHGTWSDLTDPKHEHRDQVECYATYLGLSGVIFMYVDRMYGRIKCYETEVKDYQKMRILSRVSAIMDSVTTNIAPAGLPKGDKWCSAAYCPYYKKCSEYGR